MCVRLQILGGIIDWNRTFDLEDGGMAGHDVAPDGFTGWRPN
jgi:hypothetical protein